MLTDGGIVYADDGTGAEAVSRPRRLGAEDLALAGKRSAIITGRSSPLVEVRAAELGIDLVIQGAADKLPAYRDLLRRRWVARSQVCYVGDDVPDVPVLRDCGLAVAVADACAEARAAAHYVTGAAAAAARSAR